MTIMAKSNKSKTSKYITVKIIETTGLLRSGQTVDLPEEKAMALITTFKAKKAK